MMDIFSGLSQQVVLARAGKLVVFTSYRSSLIGGLLLPSLDDYDIKFGFAGQICSDGGMCEHTQSALNVVVGGERKIVTPGQTASIGTLSLSIEDVSFYADPGDVCGIPASATMAGFTAP